MVPHSDETLLGLVAAHDDQAFEELFTRHYSRLVSFLRVAHNLRDAVAEDVATEAFIAVLRYHGQFDRGKSSFKTWLYRIAINKTIDAFRAGREHQTISLEEVIQTLVSAEGETRDEQREIARAMGRLPANERQLLWLKYFMGFTEVEIATATDAHLGTIATRLRTARKRLREFLAPSSVGVGA